MFPPYRYMDSYPHTSPHHKDHIPYPYHHYPSWEAVSPQTIVDTLRPPSSFAPWTINGSVIHPSPTDCNGCCSHSYPSGYYSFRPLCPHIPPPPQVYYYGLYPPYYGSYPPFAIPPHYPADQNPYDYNNVKAHCCGCPDHTCNRSDNHGVKIEEQKSKSEWENESPSLIGSPNHPYPVVFIPPSYSKDKETSRSSESSPALGNGWIPMVSSPNGVKQDGDGKKSLLTDERRNQFPLPIIWMPSDQKLEDAVKDLKGINSNPKVEEELPPKVKIIPLKLLEDEKHGEKPQDVDDKCKTLGHPEVVADKERRIKTIPVKHTEEDNQKRLSTDEKNKNKEKEKSLSIPEKKEENGAKKSSDSKQLSQAKTSKLPPVCLRVDPLPRKKTANGASRSPSPPGLKDKEKAHKGKTEKEQPIIRDKEEMPKKEIQVVDVIDKLRNEAEKSKNKSQDTMTTILNGEPAKVVDNQQLKKGTGLEAMKVKTLKILENGKEVEKGDEKQPFDKAPHEIDERKRHMENTESIISQQRKESKILSQSDAATHIQSVFRGYEVRRWQPLEKLRKIHQIHQKAEVVKKQILEFEASSKDEGPKQKAMISETIMNLLLQLDTIQGLHQSVRDVRKSVARELISLQEKLDSLGSPTIMEHEKMKVEHRSTGTTSDYEAISVAESSAATNFETEHVSSHSVKATHSSDLTFMDRKEEATIEQQRDVELVMAESPDSATGPDTSKLLNVEEGSTPEEHEETTSLKEHLSSALEERVESHLMEKEQSSGLEEATKPLASTSQEVFEAPSTSKDEVAKLEADRHVESRRINTLIEQVIDELCNPEAENYAKADVELEKSPILSVEREVAEGAAEESELSFEATNPELVQFVELTPGIAELGHDSDVKVTISPSDKVDIMNEDLQVPELQNSDLVGKTVADTDAVHIDAEVPCSEQAVLGTCVTDNGNVQCIVGNLEKQAADADSTVAGLPVPTYKGPSSGALEPGKEDGMNPMLLPDAMDIIEDESISSVETFQVNVDKVDGEAPEEGKDSPLRTVRHLSSPTYNKGHSLEEAFRDQTNSMLLPDATNINNGQCISTDEAFEANVNKVDGAAAEEEKNGLVPGEDMFPLITLEATISKSNSKASGQEQGLPHPNGTAKLDGVVPANKLSKEEKKLVEENEKLREMLEKLLEAGKVQLGVIADLNGRVKDLERKLSQKKRCKVKSFKSKRSSPSKVAS